MDTAPTLESLSEIAGHALVRADEVERLHVAHEAKVEHRIANVEAMAERRVADAEAKVERQLADAEAKVERQVADAAARADESVQGSSRAVETIQHDVDHKLAAATRTVQTLPVRVLLKMQACKLFSLGFAE